MNKWMANEQARNNIARRWLAVRLWRDLAYRMGQSLGNPHNQAGEVWEDNKNRDWMTDDVIRIFQDTVEFHIRELRGNAEFLSLLNGMAPDGLIKSTLLEYRNSGCRKGRK